MIGLLLDFMFFKRKVADMFLCFTEQFCKYDASMMTFLPYLGLDWFPMQTILERSIAELSSKGK